MRFLFGDYTLDVDRRELRCRDALVAVEPQVFDLLLHVIRNRDRVVSRDDLLEAVWNGRIVSDSTVGQRINAARRAIGDSGEQQKLSARWPAAASASSARCASRPMPASLPTRRPPHRQRRKPPRPRPSR
jgi:hypothetical protein